MIAWSCYDRSALSRTLDRLLWMLSNMHLACSIPSIRALQHLRHPTNHLVEVAYCTTPDRGVHTHTGPACLAVKVGELKLAPASRPI
jgi:hypothetical protein